MIRVVFALLICSIALCDAGCSPWKKNHRQTVEVQLPAGPTPENAELAEEKLAKAVKWIEHDKLQHAEKLLLESIQLDPTLGPAHNNLGLVYYRRRQLYDAAHAYQKAMEFMPGDAIPRNNLGMTCEEGDRIDDAIMYYQEAQALEPSNPVYLGNLVRARLRRGDRDDSVAWMLKDLVFLDTRPDWVEWARQELCVYLPRTGLGSDPELCPACPVGVGESELPGEMPTLPILPADVAPGKATLPPLPEPDVVPSARDWESAVP